MASDKDRFVYTRRQAIGLGAAALGVSALARMFPAYAADVISGATISTAGETISGAKFKKKGPYQLGLVTGSLEIPGEPNVSHRSRRKPDSKKILPT